jgi:hypothetical protein
MTSQYNAGTPGAPVGLPGFGPAAPDYGSPELNESAAWAQQHYPDVFARNGAGIMAALKTQQDERFQDPRLYVAAAVAASRGLEVLAAERGIPLQQGQPAVGQPANPSDPYGVYQSAAPAGVAVLPEPVRIDRLPARYRELLEHYGTTPQVVDEYLTRTELKSGRAKTIEEARARWVKAAMHVGGQLDSDNITLIAPVAGVDMSNIPPAPQLGQV